MVNKMKLSVLGPIGTYTCIAAELLKNKYELDLYPSIIKSILAIDDDVDALIPLENTLDGFVFEGLDAITKYGYHIVEQVKLDVGFNFVSDVPLNEIKTVYVQFKAHGQCLEFLNDNNFNLYITQSNIESLDLFLANKDSSAAIIPTHIDTSSYRYVVKNVTDSLKNETRFVRVTKSLNTVIQDENLMASLLVTPINDRAGLLYDILKVFSNYNLNLKSIVSRPRRDVMGRYSFYIEFDIKKDNLEIISKVTNELENDFNKVKVIGIYNKLQGDE